MTTLPLAAASAVEHNLGPSAQVPPGEGREFDVAGKRIAVFRMRVSGEVYATQAECPHQKGPLADGLTGNGVVVCPFHAWRFDLRTGTPLLGDCAVAVYPARINESGDVLVTL
jgi:nitrite reductase (NADH) small subunit